MKPYFKLLLILFFALLPWHALIITTLKCKFGIDTDIIRFWKEFVVILLLFVTFIKVITSKVKLDFLLKGNYLVGVAISFIITSLIFIGFPYLEFKLVNFLGFKYDVFFIFCLLIGIYLGFFRKNFNLILKTIFISGFIALFIFLPVYLTGNIAKISEIFGYSNIPSIYEANSCISFAQSVNGQNRFQGTFGGPITFSIFYVVFYLIYVGFILHRRRDRKRFFSKLFTIILILIPSLYVIPSIYFSYSKTTIIGLGIGILLFLLLAYKYVFKKSFKKKFLYFSGGAFLIGLIGLVIYKIDLFLHPDSILNRFENLKTSMEMFIYNPLGYGLGVAGPASQIGKSIESIGDWSIIAQSTSATALFLPENWYVQIFLEQGIIGGFIFISFILVLGFKLFEIVKKEKSFLSIGIFASFVSICIMALVCHAFEDAGTVYPLFLIYGIFIANKLNLNKGV